MDRLPDRNRRQDDVAIGQIGLRIVGAFDVGPQVSRKLDRLAHRREDRPLRLDRDGDAVGAGVGHLAGDRAFPNQVVELELVGAEPAAERLGKLERMAGRPDRLVGLLGVLDLRLIDPRRRREVFRPVLRGYQFAGPPRPPPRPAWSSRSACR